eukprot:GEMP01043657.1.p1 GENE.GEMP01043657.1~~GEMP01043657.1.p1  ORF type:complete len:327 (+),score=54.21 GEMP01043657.1:85-981(+)
MAPNRLLERIERLEEREKRRIDFENKAEANINLLFSNVSGIKLDMVNHVRIWSRNFSKLQSDLQAELQRLQDTVPSSIERWEERLTILEQDIRHLAILAAEQKQQRAQLVDRHLLDAHAKAISDRFDRVNVECTRLTTKMMALQEEPRAVLRDFIMSEENQKKQRLLERHEITEKLRALNDDFTKHARKLNQIEETTEDQITPVSRRMDCLEVAQTELRSTVHTLCNNQRFSEKMLKQYYQQATEIERTAAESYRNIDVEVAKLSARMSINPSKSMDELSGALRPSIALLLESGDGTM